MDVPRPHLQRQESQGGNDHRLTDLGFWWKGQMRTVTSVSGWEPSWHCHRRKHRQGHCLLRAVFVLLPLCWTVITNFLPSPEGSLGRRLILQMKAHSILRRLPGTMRMWGENSKGQCPNTADTAASARTPVCTLPKTICLEICSPTHPPPTPWTAEMPILAGGRKCWRSPSTLLPYKWDREAFIGSQTKRSIFWALRTGVTAISEWQRWGEGPVLSLVKILTPLFLLRKEDSLASGLNWEGQAPGCISKSEERRRVIQILVSNAYTLMSDLHYNGMC